WDTEDPLRGRHRRAPPVDARSRPRHGRRRLAGPAPRGLGAGGVRRGRAGEPRPGGVSGAVGGGRDEGTRGATASGRPQRSRVQSGTRGSARNAGGDAPAPRRAGPRTDRTMTAAKPIRVLAMAYGTASGPDDGERYYTDI